MNQYFDAVISVDTYQYFGANEQYLDGHLTPLVKEGGIFAIVMPGVKMEFDGIIPVELQPFLSLNGGDFHWHTCDWWRKLWEQSPNVFVESVEKFQTNYRMYNATKYKLYFPKTLINLAGSQKLAFHPTLPPEIDKIRRTFIKAIHKE